MASRKVYFLVCLLVFNACLHQEAEADVIKKVKDTFSSIKNFFRHGHSEHEHCDQSKEDISENTIDGNVRGKVSTPSSTTTDFPKLDVRIGVDDEPKSSTERNPLNRRLIAPGANDGCPNGQRMGIGGRCRTEI